MGIFDKLQEVSFDCVTNVMGYNASWSPSSGGATKTGKVLLKNPTEKYGYLGNQEYQLPQFDPLHWVMEYREGVFDGLKAASDARGELESVTINNQQFFVSAVYSKFDGKTYLATLQPNT
jgi:hypothetical protein